MWPLPMHPVAAGRTHQYLESLGHHLADTKGPLFIPVRGKLNCACIPANGIHTVVTFSAKNAGIEVESLCVHGPRATAATNALEHETDIAKVQAWLGHANIGTTKIYDRQENRPEDSPTSSMFGVTVPAKRHRALAVTIGPAWSRSAPTVFNHTMSSTTPPSTRSAAPVVAEA